MVRLSNLVDEPVLMRCIVCMTKLLLTAGRLAMVAMVGIIVQANATQAGPIDNLLTHLSGPWNRTVIQTLSGSAF